MPVPMPYSYGFRSALAAGTVIMVARPATLAPPRPAVDDDTMKLVEKSLARGIVQPPSKLPNDTLQSPPGIPVSAIPRINEVVAASHAEAMDVRSLFFEFVRDWKATRNPTSIASRMVAHPSYRSIIRLGPAAIGLVLEELRREPDEWFYALARLTGENPVPDACRGRFPQMTTAWIQWGRANGYLD